MPNQFPPKTYTQKLFKLPQINFFVGVSSLVTPNFVQSQVFRSEGTDTDLEERYLHDVGMTQFLDSSLPLSLDGGSESSVQWHDLSKMFAKEPLFQSPPYSGRVQSSSRMGRLRRCSFGDVLADPCGTGKTLETTPKVFATPFCHTNVQARKLPVYKLLLPLKVARQAKLDLQAPKLFV